MDITAKLAKRNIGVDWSGIRVMFALADRIDGVVNLGIGGIRSEAGMEDRPERTNSCRRLSRIK